MKFFLSFLLPIFVLISCANHETELSIKPVEEHTIEDAKPYIGDVYNVKFLSSDHFFIYDNRANIKEFKDYKAVQLHGKTGNGPCEHGSLNNFAVTEDSLFMLDREQSKYLAYAIEDSPKDNCVEVFENIVARLSGMQVMDNGKYFIRGSLQKHLAPDTPIVYTMDNNASSIDSTDVHFKDLPISLPLSPIRLSMATDKRNGKLYFYLPLTKKIFTYTPDTDEIQSSPIQLYVAEDQNVYTEKDLRKLMKLINDEIEVVFDLFALEDKVALGYKKGTGEDQFWGLRIYDVEGQTIAEKKFDNRVVYMEEGTLMTLQLDIGKKQNPYSLIEYEYSLE